MSLARRMTLAEAIFAPLPDDALHRASVAPAAGGAVDTGAAKAAKASLRPEDIPGGPDSPWDLSGASWWEIAKRVKSEIGKDRVMSVAAGVTFFGLLALFPAITAFVSIFGLVADQQTILSLTSMIERFLPGDAAQIVTDQVAAVVNAPGQSLSIAMMIGLATALYSAMGGAKALIEALNVAWFETETRGFLALNLTALAFTLGGIALIGLMIGVVAVLPPVLAWLPLGNFAETALGLARWPVTFGVLLIALAAIYRWGPSREDAAWHWVSPGAVFAAIGLIVASLGFSWYVSNFGSYNKTYGSLGAVVVLLMWLWITSMVVLVGAEINSEAERQVQMENGIPLEGDDAKPSA